MPERFMRGIEAVNGIVWGPMGLGLLFGTGLLLTVRTGGFQLRRWGYWMQHTLGAILTDRSVTAHTAREEQAISQFQSLCTALASTIGTGNLVGVATAILSGGAGAVFWMWVMALLGMMTSYAENVLGRNIAYETTKPRPIDNVAAKKPISILGPNLAIFLRSQRNNIKNNIAYNIGFLTDLYTALVALKSHTFKVQRSISPRYISTIGGAKLKKT